MREANTRLASHGSHLNTRVKTVKIEDPTEPADLPWKHWWAEGRPACRPLLPRWWGRRGSAPGGWRAARPSWPTPVSGRRPPGCRGRSSGGRGPAGRGPQSLQYQTVREGGREETNISRPDKLGRIRPSHCMLYRPVWSLILSTNWIKSIIFPTPRPRFLLWSPSIMA